MHCADFFGVGDQINRANLDGSEVERVFTDPLRSLTGIAISRLAGFKATTKGNRYVSLTTPDEAGVVALQISSPDFPCLTKYVDLDGEVGDSPIYQSMNMWDQIQVFGQEVIPGVSYDFRFEFADGRVTPFAGSTTYRWGDVVGIMKDSLPDGVADMRDVMAIVDGFLSYPLGPNFERYDITPMIPDGMVNIRDVLAGVDAFLGSPYPYDISDSCP